MNICARNKRYKFTLILIAFFTLLFEPNGSAASIDSSDTYSNYTGNNSANNITFHFEEPHPKPHKCFDIFHYSGTATTRSEKVPTKQSKSYGINTGLNPLSVSSAKYCSIHTSQNLLLFDNISVLSRSMRNRN